MFMLSILMLSIAGHTFAQTNADWLSEQSTLPKQQYPVLVRENRQVVIPLENGNIVILGLQRNDDLLRFRNVDSLMTLFLQDFAQVKDTLRTSAASFKALYQLIQWRTHPAFLALSGYGYTDPVWHR